MLQIAAILAYEVYMSVYVVSLTQTKIPRKYFKLSESMAFCRF